MENIIEETRYIMKKYNIKANKSLGQNFLISQNVVENIVGSSNIGENDLVIEVGPGLGTLTKYLLEKAKKVICPRKIQTLYGILFCLTRKICLKLSKSHPSIRQMMINIFL